MEPIKRKQRKTTPGGEYVKVVDVDQDQDLQNASQQFNDDDYSNGEYRDDEYWIDDDSDIDSYIDDLQSDDYSEDGINQFLDPIKDPEASKKPRRTQEYNKQAHDEPLTKSSMSDDEMRVESYSLASNISKLMKDVTSEDVDNISDKVIDFVRNFKVGTLSSKNNSTTYKTLKTK